MAKFEVIPTPLSDLVIIRPQAFEDSRGFFMEAYAHAELAELGVGATFVQDNHSLSRATGVLRGLHYQKPPFAQAKLIRCIRGRIWDVAVDIRRGSPSFGKAFGLELSAENKTQLFVPVGFAHGFVTLEPDTEIIYKVTAPYSAACDAGIRWDDPTLNVPWPIPAGGPVLSDKDRTLPSFTEAEMFP